MTRHDTPIPNRLCVVPQELYDHMDDVLSRGYQDGHTDAENGHDERVRASLA